MVTIFNRKQLIITYDITVQAKIRAVLSANKVDYSINPSIMTPNVTRSVAEYKFYVKKSDYDKASFLIRDVFR